MYEESDSLIHVPAQTVRMWSMGKWKGGKFPESLAREGLYLISIVGI